MNYTKAEHGLFRNHLIVGHIIINYLLLDITQYTSLWSLNHHSIKAITLNTYYFISTINQIYYKKHIIYLFQPFSWFLGNGLYLFCKSKSASEAIGLFGPMSSSGLNSPNKPGSSKVTTPADNTWLHTKKEFQQTYTTIPVLSVSKYCYKFYQIINFSLMRERKRFFFYVFGRNWIVSIAHAWREMFLSDVRDITNLIAYKPMCH